MSPWSPAATGLLLANYVGAVVLAFRSPAFNTRLMAGAHALLGVAAVRYAAIANSQGFSKAAIAGFYRGIWNLFYAVRPDRAPGFPFYPAQRIAQATRPPAPDESIHAFMMYLLVMACKVSIITRTHS